MAEETKKKSGGAKSPVAKKTTAAKKTAATKKPSATTKKVASAKKPAAVKTKTSETVKKTVEKEQKEVAAKKEAVASKSKDSSKEKVSAKKEAGPLKVEKRKEEQKSFAKKQKRLNVTSFVKHKEVKKKWLILDAAGKSLGRVAVVAASLLKGKHKVDITPNVDCGDCVIIVNCKDVVLTGKKLEQKVRYRHSGWIGGLKETKYSELMKKEPQKAMMYAVKGMLPRNSLGAKMAKHLRVYKDDMHGQEAQNPEVFKF